MTVVVSVWCRNDYASREDGTVPDMLVMIDE